MDDRNKPTDEELEQEGVERTEPTETPIKPKRSPGPPPPPPPPR